MYKFIKTVYILQKLFILHPNNVRSLTQNAAIETHTLTQTRRPHQTSPLFLSLPLILLHFTPSALPPSSPTIPFVLRTPIYHGVKVERDIIMGCRAGERRQG